MWDYDYPSNQVMIPRAQKYSYDYFDIDMLLGDVNNDDTINILDVISTINIVLNSDDYNLNADMNQDGTINILDVVSLVNVILG